jgi:uncharacterized protein YndB with AHSA1/START domain
VIVDRRVGGLFYLCASHEGREWPHYGRFLVLDRPQRIQHTWMSESTRGLESTVTVTFEADGDRTRVTLTHAGLPDDEPGRHHREGWDFVLGTIESHFAKR